MRLQKNSSLALYSVIEFAGAPERHIAAAEIAEKYDVSPHHLAKVLAELARNGIVESVRGAGGGYRFIGNARRLTLMDIIQLFEELGSTGQRARRGGTEAGRRGTWRGLVRDRPERQSDLQLDHAGDDASPGRTPSAREHRERTLNGGSCGRGDAAWSVHGLARGGTPAQFDPTRIDLGLQRLELIRRQVPIAPLQRQVVGHRA